MNRNRVFWIALGVMAAVVLLTWGSIGSEITAIGIVFLIAGELYRRITEKRDEIYGDYAPIEEE